METLDPKTDGATQGIVEENINKLRELFPDAFTEGSDEEGPRWRVDFDALREVLGDYVEDQRERYSFTWNGKARARRIAQMPSTGTLRPCPEESVNSGMHLTGVCTTGSMRRPWRITRAHCRNSKITSLRRKLAGTTLRF